jgi:hypothetical protein
VNARKRSHTLAKRAESITSISLALQQPVMGRERNHTQTKPKKTHDIWIGVALIAEIEFESKRQNNDPGRGSHTTPP